jgi:biotin carboxyl carrier protein
MRLHVEQAGDVRQVTVAPGRDPGSLDLTIGDAVLCCDVRDLGNGHLSIRMPDGSMHDVVVETGLHHGQRLIQLGGARMATAVSTRPPRVASSGGASHGPLRITAPMPGKIVRLPLRVGDTVEARQPVVVIEAMKMENALAAGRAGRIAEILVQEGMSVEAGRPLVVVE